MEDRVRPTRSGLFTIELMIAVGVFALCAAICVGLFVRSEVSSRHSADQVRAVSEAKNVSECFQAAGGDLAETAALVGGVVENGKLVLRYDGDWRQLTTADPTALTFWLEVAPEQADGLIKADLTVWETDNTEYLLSWPVSAWEVTP